MRRLLAAAAVLVAGAVSLVPTALPASAHGDWSTQWTDPVPTETIDGQQAGYLDGLRGISGVVSHSHVIESVNLLLAVPHEPSGSECDATGAPASVGGGGTTVSFTFQLVFPCNIVYRVRVTASAQEGEGSTLEPDPAPAPADMPLLVAVAIPPDPVDDVRAELAGTNVRISWSPNSERDLIGYQVVRVVDGERVVIAEVVAGDSTTITDGQAPAGKSVSYDVIAVRPGPTTDRRTVSSSSSQSDAVDVPAPASDDDDESDDDGDSDGDGDSDDSDGDGDGDGDGDSDDGDGDGPSLGTSSGSGGGSQPGSIGVSSRPANGGGPPTTADTGFSETLPFGEQAPGAVAGPTTGGDVVAAFDDGDDAPFLNEETWTFLAAGLALFMGSMVIRYVTRRAAAGY